MYNDNDKDKHRITKVKGLNPWKRKKQKRYYPKTRNLMSDDEKYLDSEFLNSMDIGD